MAMALATIGNDGLAMKPHIVRETVSASGVRKVVQPEPIGQAISPEAARTLRQMMGVVGDGSSRSLLDSEAYRVGGKTGTANIASDNGGYKPDAYISSFAGLAPLF